MGMQNFLELFHVQKHILHPGHLFQEYHFCYTWIVVQTRSDIFPCGFRWWHRQSIFAEMVMDELKIYALNTNKEKTKWILEISNVLHIIHLQSKHATAACVTLPMRTFWTNGMVFTLRSIKASRTTLLNEFAEQVKKKLRKSWIRSTCHKIFDRYWKKISV